MKNNKIIGLLLLSIFFVGLTANVFGQKRQISGDEFNTAFYKASQKQYDISRRVEKISETYANGVPTNSTNTISEHLLPGRSRYVFKEKVGDVVTEAEVITIENFQYSRENGGAWTKIDLSKNSGTGYGSGVGSRSISCRQITVEATFFNNYSAQLFEELVINSSNKGLIYAEAKNWISDDGLLLKSETSEGFLTPKIETSKTITTIEYNPNIKIEAPIK